MAGKNIFNSDTEIQGKAIIYTVPNATGTVLTYNPTTKEVSTRTNAELISDMNLMTTNTAQDVSGAKTYITTAGGAWNNNALRVYADGTTSPGVTFFKGGNSVGQLIYIDATRGFAFINEVGSAYRNVEANGFYKGGSSDDYVLLGGTGHKLVSDFAQASQLGDYVTLNTTQTINGKKTYTTNFNNYTPDGLFDDVNVNHALNLVTPGGRKINFGYKDYGAGQYFGRIGFTSSTNWSLGAIGDYFTIGVGNDGLETFKITSTEAFINNNLIWNAGNLDPDYSENSSKLFSTDASYGYGSSTPYYGFLSYKQANNRWRFEMSPATPKEIEVAFADNSNNSNQLGGLPASDYWAKHISGPYRGVNTNQPFAILNDNQAQILLAKGILASNSYGDYVNVPDGGIFSSGLIQTANDGNSAQWYASFNWGNHASAGYATENFVNTNFVNKFNDEVVGGVKKLTGAYTEWLALNDLNNARGFAQSLGSAFLLGTLNDKDVSIYRNAVAKVTFEDTLSTFYNPISIPNGTANSHAVNLNQLNSVTLPLYNNYVGNQALLDRRVIGEMIWKNYGNGHTITDLSNGTAPSGTTKSNVNPDLPWSDTYPVLMGWNGINTFGVRVDSARTADNVGGYNSTTLHKVNFTGGLNNASDSNKNTSWFEYNWAGTGRLGSVINFSGLDNNYASEIFLNYQGGQLGFRSRNGDTNTWNNPEWAWHTGNSDVHKAGGVNLLPNSGTILLSGNDHGNSDNSVLGQITVNGTGNWNAYTGVTNKDYTPNVYLTGQIEVFHNDTVSRDFLYYFYIYGSPLVVTHTVPPNVWTKIVTSGKTTGLTNSMLVGLGSSGMPAGTVVQYRNIQIEESRVASTYRRAFEDNNVGDAWKIIEENTYRGIRTDKPFSIVTEAGFAQKINTKGILVSNAYQDEGNVPDNGIWSKGLISTLNHGDSSSWYTGYNNSVTAIGWGNHALAGYVTQSVLNANDRTYLTDSRGAVRPPSYYDDRYAQWDFQNTNDTGAGGDVWHGILTVAKWDNFLAAHRQEQLLFTGDDLKRRTAIDDDTWGVVKTIWDSGNFNPANYQPIGNYWTIWDNGTNKGFDSNSTFYFINNSSSQRIAVGGLTISNGYTDEAYTPEFGVFSKGLIKAQKGVAKIENVGYGEVNKRTNPTSIGYWGAPIGALIIEFPATLQYQAHLEMSLVNEQYIQLYQKLQISIYEFQSYSQAVLINDTNNPDIVSRIRIGQAPSGNFCIIINSSDTQWGFMQAVVDSFTGGKSSIAEGDWTSYMVTDLSLFTINFELEVQKAGKSFTNNQLNNKVSKSGDTMTGSLRAPTVYTDQLITDQDNTMVRVGNNGDIGLVKKSGFAGFFAVAQQGFVVKYSTTVGDFTPSSTFIDLFVANASGAYVNGNQLWDSSNFNPDSKVNKAGDTMTGNLSLPNATLNSHAVNLGQLTVAVQPGDTAFSWGNHANAGYLTSSSLVGYVTQTSLTTQLGNYIPTSHASNSITTTNIDNWNEIYNNGIRVNVAYGSSNVAIVQDYVGGESGLFDINEEVIIAGTYEDNYVLAGKYSKEYGIFIDKATGNVGYRTTPDDLDEHYFNGSVKTNEGFKHLNEDPDQVFTADGGLTNLNTDIINDGGNLALKIDHYTFTSGTTHVVDSSHTLVNIRVKTGTTLNINRRNMQKVTVMNLQGSSITIEYAGIGAVYTLDAFTKATFDCSDAGQVEVYDVTEVQTII